MTAELLALLDAGGYGTTDRLLEASGPSLGSDGRAELRRLLQARLASLSLAHARDSRGRFMVSLRFREMANVEAMSTPISLRLKPAAGRRTSLATSRKG